MHTAGWNALGYWLRCALLRARSFAQEAPGTEPFTIDDPVAWASHRQIEYCLPLVLILWDVLGDVEMGRTLLVSVLVNPPTPHTPHRRHLSLVT